MATRFYFPLDTAAPVTPSFDGGWNHTAEAVRRKLEKTKGNSTITIGTRIGSWFTPPALDRQYISDPISAQTISGTFKMQLMTREYATADNVDQGWLKLYVVNNDGSSITGTLLSLGNYGTTGEFISNASHRNKIYADGDSLTSVTSNSGDRLVIEIGFKNSGAGTSPEASAKWGENATDLPENDTQTTNGAGWIEFSGTIGMIVDGQVAVDSISSFSEVAGLILKGELPVNSTSTFDLVGNLVLGGILTVTSSTTIDFIGTVTGGGGANVFGAILLATASTTAFVLRKIEPGSNYPGPNTPVYLRDDTLNIDSTKLCTPAEMVDYLDGYSIFPIDEGLDRDMCYTILTKGV